MPKELTDSHDTERWDANLEQMYDEMDSEEDNAFKGVLIGMVLGLAMWAVVLGIAYLLLA